MGVGFFFCNPQKGDTNEGVHLMLTLNLTPRSTPFISLVMVPLMKNIESAVFGGIDVVTSCFFYWRPQSVYVIGGVWDRDQNEAKKY